MSCRVISVFSTKGGVGKSLIAANLTAALHRHVGASAILFELDPFKADAVTMLGASDIPRVNQKVTDKASIAAILRELSQSSQYVIIDVGSAFTDLAVAALELSNMILLVTTPDAIAVQHTQRAIEAFQSMRFPQKMLKVALNRAESRGSAHSAEVAEQVATDVIAAIPSDGRAAGVSTQRGVPVVLSEPGTRIAEAFREFAELVHGDPSLFVAQVKVDLESIPQRLQEAVKANQPAQGDGRAQTVQDPILALKQQIHSRLVDELDLKRLDTNTSDPQKAKELRQRVERAVVELMTKERGFVADAQTRVRIVKELVDEILGLGPLEDLMADPDISDILVNGASMIYIEKEGKLYHTDKRFISDQQLLALIERIIAPLGRRIDESNPMVDARLPDGSRVNAIIPPLALRGPMLSIRKFSIEQYTIEDLIRLDTLTQVMAEFLRVCVRSRKNIIVSGGTGSGKTTFLNVLSAFIPEEERIITIEDAAELKLHQRHVASLEAKPPNIEGRGEITIRQLFRNALRMRPDRIVIGECRGGETLDMLQAMNTGHDGSLTTIHANSPQDVVARLDSLVLMSTVDLPVRSIREQIASSIDLIVHVARYSDGSRKVSHITEITGMDEQANVITHNLFIYQQKGIAPDGKVQGQFRATGAQPTFLEELRSKGMPFEERLFEERTL